MRVLAASDKYKGTATSRELNAAVVEAARGRGADARAIVVSDGGDGLLDAFGGATRTATVAGPDGRPRTVDWRLVDGTAVIESARACGLVLAGGRSGNNPLAATSAGVGQLVEAAVAAGADRVVVGLGGSACTDGGLPALDAMSARTVRRVADGEVELVVCCDVTTRFVDAAVSFAPQKGATSQQVQQLRDRLHGARRELRQRFGRDVGAMPGGGAAGGLAGGLAAIGGRLRSGFDVVAAATGLDSAVATADLVVTGEGRLDESSLAGKAVSGVARLAAAAGADLVAIVGSCASDLDVPFEVVSLTRRFGARRAQQQVLECVREVTGELVDGYFERAGAK